MVESCFFCLLFFQTLHGSRRLPRHHLRVRLRGPPRPALQGPRREELVRRGAGRVPGRPQEAEEQPGGRELRHEAGLRAAQCKRPHPAQAGGLLHGVQLQQAGELRLES